MSEEREKLLPLNSEESRKKLLRLDQVSSMEAIRKVSKLDNKVLNFIGHQGHVQGTISICR